MLLKLVKQTLFETFNYSIVKFLLHLSEILGTNLAET